MREKHLPSLARMLANRRDRLGRSFTLAVLSADLLSAGHRVGLSTVSRWESGLRLPDPAALPAIAQAYRLSLTAVKRAWHEQALTTQPQEAHS